MDFALFSDIVARRFADRVLRVARTAEAIETLGKAATPIGTLGFVELLDGRGLSEAEVRAAEADVAAEDRDNRMASVREERNRLLRESDWTQAGLADSPLTAEQRAAWAAYRTALRNIPRDFATPADVVWPVAP